jgi:hypothetical protein
MKDTAQPDADGAVPAGHKNETANKRKRKPRSPLAKLFLIKPLGYVKLFAYCVLVGFVMLAIRFNPADPGFDAGTAVQDLWANTIGAAGWAATHLWEPALAGATVVLPIWVIWRLVTMPFRR